MSESVDPNGEWLCIGCAIPGRYGCLSDFLGDPCGWALRDRDSRRALCRDCARLFSPPPMDRVDWQAPHLRTFRQAAEGFDDLRSALPGLRELLARDVPDLAIGLSDDMQRVVKSLRALDPQVRTRVLGILGVSRRSQVKE